MAPPRSTHVRDGRRLLLLDPARGKERLRKIQHDGVVVDAAELRQGFAKQLREEEEVLQGGGGARAIGLVCSSFSPLYIGPRERGRHSPCPFLQGRVRPRVGRSPSSPRHLGGAFPL